MKTKPLTFLLSLTFLFLFSGSYVVFGGDLQDATDAYERKDYETAYKLVLPLAEQGDVEAQYNLALMYDNGQGVPQDNKKALNWYRLAAEQGYAEAQTNLGLMYSKGKGVSQDYKEAVKWFRLSAEQEKAIAQYNLGFMYSKGKGVPQDYKEALKWYRLAAEQGFTEAQNNLGVMYANGEGVLQDYKEAIKWYRLAAEQGDAKAQYNLGFKYSKGQGVPRDYKEAVKWIRLSAEQGYAAAQSDLGFLYKEGQGVPQDYKEAVRLYRLSAEQEFGLAQYNLGYMYEKGQGVSQDYVLALMWWIIASYNGDQSAIHTRKILVKKMSPSQIEKAQQLARNWNTNKMRTAESLPSGTPQPSIPPQPPKSKDVAIATGTGFLFGSQDYIITNYHVVKGISEVKVKFLNGESINAEVVGRDTQNDIAVLKLTKSPSFQSREMKFGDSSRVRMGDKVFTIGYPHIGIMGLKPKYTEGVISAVTGIKDNPTVFQTTVPIQPDNSGGPLFNEKGEVVGLTTSSLSLLAIESMGAIPQNVNYAVKSSFVKNIIGTIPEALLSNRGIVVVPTDSNSRSDFIEAISKNVVLILGKVD